MATTLFNNNQYHTRQPNANAWVSYEVTRPNAQSSYVRWTFYYGVTINNGYYGRSNSTGFTIEVDGESRTVYIVGNGGSSSISFDANDYSTNGLTSVKISVWHHQGSNANPTGSDNNCSHGFATYVWSSGSVSVPVYNPYSPFSLSIDSVTQIGKVDRDTFNVTYNLNGGTKDITTCELRVYKGGSRIDTIGISGSKSQWNQTASFKPTTSLYSHGFNYTVSVYASDGTTAIETTALTFYTYQEPKLTSVSVQNSSPQNANTPNKFTLNGTNNRKWTNYEQEFQTHYRIKRQDGTYTSWTNLGNINSWSRNESQMRSLIPKQYDGQTNTIEFRRYNVSGRWYSATKSVNMVLYYRPRVGITSRKCNISYKQ